MAEDTHQAEENEEDRTLGLRTELTEETEKLRRTQAEMEMESPVTQLEPTGIPDHRTSGLKVKAEI